jgi:hypothetical protein
VRARRRLSPSRLPPLKGYPASYRRARGRARRRWAERRDWASETWPCCSRGHTSRVSSVPCWRRWTPSAPLTARRRGVAWSTHPLLGCVSDMAGDYQRFSGRKRGRIRPNTESLRCSPWGAPSHRRRRSRYWTPGSHLFLAWVPTALCPAWGDPRLARVGPSETWSRTRGARESGRHHRRHCTYRKHHADHHRGRWRLRGLGAV